MKNLFQQKNLDALISRLTRIQQEMKPRWGKMNAHQALVHMTDPLLAALGDRPVKSMAGMLSKWPAKIIMSQVFPWPKSAPTAPEFIQGSKGTPPVDFEKDKQALMLAIHRFSQRKNSSPFEVHPVFGRLSNGQYARLMWRHINYHLQQFGI